MFEKIKKMPKVELHLHLDGSVSKEIASQLSGLKEDEMTSFMVASSECKNLSEYLTKFDFPVKLMQTKENLTLIAKDLVDNLEKEAVIYAEIRFSPLFHTDKGLTLEEVVKSVLTGLKSNSFVKTNLILCMMRGKTKEENLRVIELAEKYLNKGVVALDLAGDENKFPLEDYLELFEIAKEKKIPFTIHAGENRAASEVKKAILIGAKRIGHGIHAIENQEVLDLLKEKNILLEICPTSNVQTKAVDSYAAHPIYELYQRKVPISINTDNRTVSNITIPLEYLKLSSTFPFKVEDYKKINEMAIQGAFLEESDMKELLNLFLSKMKDLEIDNKE